MEENLFDNPPAGDPPPDDQTQTQTPPGGPDPSGERLAALEQAVADTNDSIASLTRTLAASAEQALRAERQQVDTNQTPDMDEFREALVNDPAGTIDQRAQAVVERLAGEQLTPTLNTMIEATHESLMAKHEAQITSDFGEEAWSKVVQPAINEDIGTLRERNIRALADPTAIKALVDRQIGMNWKDLTTKQAEHEKAKEAAVNEEISRGLPSGGAPKVRLNPDQPDEDIKTFWNDIEGSTGEQIDKAMFMKLHQAGNSIDDYLAVVGKQGGK